MVRHAALGEVAVHRDSRRERPIVWIGMRSGLEHRARLGVPGLCGQCGALLVLRVAVGVLIRNARGHDTLGGLSRRGRRRAEENVWRLRRREGPPAFFRNSGDREGQNDADRHKRGAH